MCLASMSPGLNPIIESYGTSGGELVRRVTIATMQYIRQIVVDAWNAVLQQRCPAAHIQYEATVLGCCCGIWWFHPMLLNVINVSNEVECGETFRVFNLILLITTGYRYFEVSLINVILALFSDDPTLLPTPSFSVQKCHSHYFSMNDKQNNITSILIQDMGLKMLYWGRYWTPNRICKTCFEWFMIK